MKKERIDRLISESLIPVYGVGALGEQEVSTELDPYKFAELVKQETERSMREAMGEYVAEGWSLEWAIKELIHDYQEVNRTKTTFCHELCKAEDEIKKMERKLAMLKDILGE